MGNPLVLAARAVRHPWRSGRRLASAVRDLLGQIWRSTTRPTRATRSMRARSTGPQATLAG